ncbi:Na+/H+ antiporter subunit G [Sphingomonas sp.]|jgi:multicomponent K+:H+ antiporter subunit G|uniref:Na+/H+ antiporter subunit G n=1 Tax=Sphingomonas sp. TaxID=28214 RepID=UPI00260AAC2E|nr:Na+/H+ antiporter subunit G [Sphingomonas sp.]MDF2494595.1 Na+/H+ antiporter subunit [Sphingomonas sp.]
MTMVVDAIIAALILLGAAFVLIGSWGLVRLPSTMERLHGPTKATTLGLGALLIGSMIFFQARLGIWTAHELLICVFLFITAPISANMIAKVHLHRLRTGAIVEPGSIAGDPPPPGGDADWATFEAPHDGPADTAAGR